MCFYLSLDGSHFAVQPALPQGLGMTLGRRVATRRRWGLFTLLAKQRSYSLDARGVAGRAISSGFWGTVTKKNTNVTKGVILYVENVEKVWNFDVWFLNYRISPFTSRG